MKKRIVCALLTLVLLVSLVPAMAMPTKAASLSISEAAVTVIKQLEGYSQKCDENGYIGYGTLCPGEGEHGTGNHTTYESKADAALRTELKSLDAAVNSFASKQGLTLTQSKHDALVLFSFQNGTAWMSGTGELRSAVTKGLKGSDFLNAICNWNTSTEDDSRRMIEANMYLYGVYSSSRPSKFIRVTYLAVSEQEGGEEEEEDYGIAMYGLDEDDLIDDGFGVDAQVGWPNGSIGGTSTRSYYYDVTTKPAPHMVPTAEGYTFTGWYVEGEFGYQKVTTLTASHNNAVLVAGWAPTTMNPGNGIAVNYLIDKSQLLSQYVYVYQDAVLDPYEYEDEDGYTQTEDYFIEKEAAKFVEAKDVDDKKIPASNFFCTDTALRVDMDLLTENGTRFCRINYEPQAGMKYVEYWVKVSNKTGTGSTTGSADDATIDLTVTVVSNLGYVNRRESASIYANKNGSYTSGTKVRIIDTATKDGFLWGKVAKDATGTASAGWIALMYTDYETVRSQQGSTTVNTGKVIATGFITYKGYVNVRSDAGTDNEIVGALYKDTEVKIYQTKFVNGLEWGLCDTGWFCLSYATITRTSNTSNTSDVGFTTYAFNGTLVDYPVVYDAPNGNPLQTQSLVGGSVTVTNLVNVDGITWGKISQGWVMVSDEDGNALDVVLNVAKFTVTSELTVRQEPATGSTRVDTLSKGVEFNVNDKLQVIVKGETIWAYAYKVGEDAKTYGGWVNLANKYVTRGDAPTVSTGDTNTATGKTATIVGADSVRVRGNASLSGKVIGSIKQGTTVNILGEQNGWYKLDYDVGNSEYDSWVYGQYVEVKEGTVSGGSNGTASTNGTGVGIIANTYGGVNVRATPGTSGTFLGKILPGTQVNILETKTVGTAQWGRVEQGWICMDYVQIISDLPQDVLDALGITGGTTGNGTTGSNNTTTGAEVAIYTGTVNQAVDIYKEQSTKSEVVRTLEAGDNVTIHKILEVVTVDESDPELDGNTSVTTTTKTTSYWAQVNEGYILSPADCIDLDTLDEATYTVTGSDTLNVRGTAGTAGGQADILHRLNKGDQVKVTNVKIVKGNVWGYIEVTPTDAVKTTDEDGNVVDVESSWTGEGWISLAYTTKGAIAMNTGNSNTSNDTTAEETKPLGSTGNTGSSGFVTNASGYKYTGKVINTDSLRVRRTASTNAAVETKLKRGASLYIYETCIAEGMAWGRCDAGWVYLYYVDMDPVSNSLVDARVVYNDNTIAYTDIDCTAVAGTYCKMAVIDIYEQVGNMVRTDLGWVSTDNLL